MIFLKTLRNIYFYEFRYIRASQILTDRRAKKFRAQQRRAVNPQVLAPLSDESSEASNSGSDEDDAPMVGEDEQEE